MSILDFHDGFLLGRIFSYNVDFRSLIALKICSKRSKSLLFTLNQKFVGLRLTLPFGYSGYSLLSSIGNSISHLQIQNHVLSDKDVSKVLVLCPNIQVLNVCECFSVSLAQFVDPVLRTQFLALIGDSHVLKKDEGAQEVLPPPLKLIIGHNTYIELHSLLSLLIQGVMIYASHIEITFEAIKFLLMNGFTKWDGFSEGNPKLNSIKNYLSIRKLKDIGFLGLDIFTPEDVFDLFYTTNNFEVIQEIPSNLYHKWPFVWGYCFKSSEIFNKFKNRMTLIPSIGLDENLLSMIRIIGNHFNGIETREINNRIWPKFLDPSCVKQFIINYRKDSSWGISNVLRGLSALNWGRWDELLECDDFVRFLLENKGNDEAQTVVIHIAKEFLRYKFPFQNIMHDLPLHSRSTLFIYLLRGSLELFDQDLRFVEMLIRKGEISLFVNFVYATEWKRLNELDRDLLKNAITILSSFDGRMLVNTLHKFGFTNWDASTEFIQKLVNRNNSPVLLELENCLFLWELIDIKKIEREEIINQAWLDLKSIYLRRQSVNLLFQTPEQIQEWGMHNSNNNNQSNKVVSYLNETEFFEDDYDQENQDQDEDEDKEEEEETDD